MKWTQSHPKDRPPTRLCGFVGRASDSTRENNYIPTTKIFYLLMAHVESKEHQDIHSEKRAKRALVTFFSDPMVSPAFASLRTFDALSRDKRNYIICRQDKRDFSGNELNCIKM